MKRTSGKLSMIGALSFLINHFWFVTGFSQSARQAYEGSYLYITDPSGRDYPHNGTPSWGDNDALTNGIAHDESNWYISSLGSDIYGFPNGSWVIWRIPVSEALDQDFSRNMSVKRVHLSDVPVLRDMRYGHAGDLDHHRHIDGVDYLFVPLTGSPLYDKNNKPIPGTTPPPAIAVFRAADLSFVSYDTLTFGKPGPRQKDVGWCAVNPTGDLYTSNDDADTTIRYEIDWSRLTTGGFLTYKDSYPLKDIAGNNILLHNMQGGEFTPSGELLYVSCGLFGLGGDRFSTDGIHVFETNTWQEIERSFNSGFRFVCCPPYFLYQFDNSLDGGDEPEGLTIWDLDDGRAPNVRGQVHVLLYTHNYFHTNKVKLKHYTRKIYVDALAPPPPPKSEYDPPPLQGTPEQPFNTVKNAFYWYPAWDGAEIVIKAGSYPETGVFSKRVRISSQGGTAIVGKK